MRIQSFENEIAEAAWVLETIRAIVNQTDPTLRDQSRHELILPMTLDRIAVLARNRSVFKELTQQFDSDAYFRGNYFVKKGSEALEMDSKIMRVFDLGTRILCNASDEIHFRQILQILGIVPSPRIGSPRDGIQKLEVLLLQIPLNGTEDNFQSDYETLIQAWRHLVSQKEVRMEDALDSIGNAASSKGDEERERILSDISVYKNTWKQFLRSASSNVNMLSAFRQFAAMGSSTTSKQKGLTLATVHTVKGLQFDIVFILGMSAGTFPDFRARTESQIVEEKSVAYVAATRAKRWIFISYPLKKRMPWGDWKPQSPSIFIQAFSENRQ